MAGLCVVAGGLVVSGATGIGVAPAADSALGCTDIWTGATGSTDWDTAGNWSTGAVPDAPAVEVCIPGGTTVVDRSTPVVVGELTVARGSSLTIGSAGAPNAASTGATLSVTSGVENDGALTVGPAGSGSAALGGPVTNTGALEVFGSVTVGATAASSVTNAGIVGLAPGGSIDLQKTSSFTNTPSGQLVVGIDGPPASGSDYGRILNGSLSLDGAVAPVFESEFTPPAGAEYVIATSSFSGTFAAVHNGATVDYSHPDALGLAGGVPATATSVGVTSNTPTSVFGQDVRLQATLATASGPAPTGSVSFAAGDLQLGSVPVATTAGITTATIDTANIPVGSQPVTATYDGDVLFGPSTSPVDELTVGPDTSNVAITATSANVAPGQRVTYTVTVSAGAPGSGRADGTVSLSDDGNAVQGCQLLQLPSTEPPQVTCSVTYDADATHSVVATYGGSHDFLPASATFTEVVAPRPTTTSVTVSSDSATSGEPVSFTVTVDAASGSPTGNVTFTDNGTPIGTSTLSTAGGVTTTNMLLTTLPLGVNSIEASFGGDTNFASSVSAATLVTVRRAATTLGLGSTAEMSASGQPVTFIANVFPVTGSGETGTVTFSYDGTVIGTASVTDGQAALTTTTLPAGTGSLTATYSGDANFAGSAAPSPLSEEVDPASG